MYSINRFEYFVQESSDSLEDNRRLGIAIRSHNEPHSLNETTVCLVNSPNQLNKYTCLIRRPPFASDVLSQYQSRKSSQTNKEH